jgi:GAF domain-containing protein
MKNFQLELERDLTLLNERLASDFAIISRIKGGDYEVVAVISNFDSVKKGDHFVTQDTYCSEVVNSDSPVTYSCVGSIQHMILHPIYTAMQLEAYLGVPLHYKGKIVGTLNFSGFSPKIPEFSEEDITDVLKLADVIEGTMESDWY